MRIQYVISLINSFGAIGDYNGPSHRPLLSTLVNITSSLRLQLSYVSINQYRGNSTFISSIETLERVKGVFKVIISIFNDIILSVKIVSALAKNHYTNSAPKGLTMVVDIVEKDEDMGMLCK